MCQAHENEKLRNGVTVIVIHLATLLRMLGHERMNKIEFHCIAFVL